MLTSPAFYSGRSPQLKSPVMRKFGTPAPSSGGETPTHTFNIVQSNVLDHLRPPSKDSKEIGKPQLQSAVLHMNKLLSDK